MMKIARQIDIQSNARLLEYPFAASVVQVSNSAIFREPGWEPRKRSYDVPPKGEGLDPERATASSMSRARCAVRNIALCNQFQYFVTWTLDPNMIDRYDAETVKKKVMKWLNNASSRKGFQYVMVPERHKDGAIHFHGLCNVGSVKLERAVNPHTGKVMSTEKGQPIYNMADWSLGFSTCIPIDEHYERSCNYLVKYMEKNCGKIFGKWYFSSRNLRRRPDVTLLPDVLYDDFIRDNANEQGLYNVPVFGDVRIAGIRLAEGY